MVVDVDSGKIADLLTFDDISSSGDACSFIDLGNGFGLKCYFDDKHARDTSYTCQEYLAGKNLAPNVGKKFSLVDHNGDAWYCFVTEVAETLVEYGIDNEQAYEEDADEIYMDLQEHYELYAREERDDWIHEVHELTGYYYMDDHAGNWGWIVRDGERKLVCIDFDTCIILENKIKKELLAE